MDQYSIRDMGMTDDFFYYIYRDRSASDRFFLEFLGGLDGSNDKIHIPRALVTACYVVSLVMLLVFNSFYLILL